MSNEQSGWNVECYSLNGKIKTQIKCMVAVRVSLNDNQTELLKYRIGIKHYWKCEPDWRANMMRKWNKQQPKKNTRGRRIQRFWKKFVKSHWRPIKYIVIVWAHWWTNGKWETVKKWIPTKNDCFPLYECPNTELDQKHPSHFMPNAI